MDSIFNIISTNISNHISDITDSTLSIIINGLNYIDNIILLGYKIWFCKKVLNKNKMPSQDGDKISKTLFKKIKMNRVFDF